MTPSLSNTPAASASTAERIDAATPPHTPRPWPLPVARSPRVEAARAELEGITGQREREERAAELATALTAGGTPLLEEDEDPGFALVSFLWHGEAPHGVLLQLNKVSDPFDPDDVQLRPLAGTALHTLTLRLPASWIGSYLLCTPREPLPAPRLHGPVDRRLLGALLDAAVEDPHAREYAPNKHLPIRFAVGRGPRAPRLRLHERPAPRLEEPATVHSPVSGAALTLHSWAHPEAGEDSPALLLLDGEVWREQYPIIPELAARIDARTMPPVRVLLLDSGGPRQRQLDYACDAAESRLLLERVRAAAGLPDRAPLVVAGQSLGGLFAALASTRHPDLLAAGVAQSPSLWWPNTGAFGQECGAWFEERARALSPAPLLLHSGALEWDLHRDVRRAAALLRTQGTLLGFEESCGGHDALWWQALLPQALEHALARTATRPARDAERELWLAAQLTGDSAVLTTAHSFSFTHTLPRQQLECAWRRVLNEAPILASRFALDGEQLRVLPAPTPEIQQLDAACAEEEHELLEWFATTPLDPERGPLAAALLVHRQDTEADTLAIAASHLALDGYGWALMLRRLTELTDPESGPQSARPLTLPTNHEPQRLTEDELCWWDEALRALPTPQAPTPKLRQARPRASRMLPEQNARLNPALEIAAGALAIAQLHEAGERGTGASADPLRSVHIAVPVLGRRDDELRTPQTAMNLLPLTVKLREGESGTELLERIRVIWMQARKHGLVRAETARRELLSGDDTRSVADLVLNIIPFTQELRIGGLHTIGRTLASGPGDAPAIALRAVPDGTVRLEADAPIAAGPLAEAFIRARKQLTDSPAEPYRHTPVRQDKVQDVLASIAGRVAEQPDAPAFLEAGSGGAPVPLCSYADLWHRARTVATQLTELGIGVEDPVAAAVERGPDGAAILLGIMLCGAAFCPLPAGPQEMQHRKRAAEVLQPAAVIASEADAAQLAAPIKLDPTRLLAAEVQNDREFTAPPPAALAYLITTSGSTGTPKPVAIERGALSRWVEAARDYLDPGPEDRVAQFAPVHFDASVEELFLSLAGGAALIPRSNTALQRIGDWLEECEQLGVTILDLPTGYWHELSRALRMGTARLPSRVRTVVVGGEAVSPARLADWHASVSASVRLVNSYGPTEATVVATWANLSPRPDPELRLKGPAGDQNEPPRHG